MPHPIAPCLWFNKQAEEAITFYCSLFSNSIITQTNYYSREAAATRGIAAGTVLSIAFELHRQPFTALIGGPAFTFNPSISLYVVCRTEEEADGLWKQLAEGGSVLIPLNQYPWSSKYGWLSDRFGLNWQIGVHTEGSFEDKISPAMLFTGPQQQLAEDAIHFYTRLFPNSSIAHIARFEDGEPGEKGSVKHAMFKLNGRTFMIMGSTEKHPFEFNEAISFQVLCDTQEEIDHYWNAFAEGGTESQCGWVRDRFGIWWQVVPSILPGLLSDPAKANQVMNAFMRMKKFDLSQLLAIG